MENHVPAYGGQVNKNSFRARYDEIVEKGLSDYCLIALTLKNFSEYLHIVGQDKYPAIIAAFFQQIRTVLEEDACILHAHYDHFYILAKCQPTLDALHPMAAAMHFAVRDNMETAFGRKLYLAMGFYPIAPTYVEYYDAQYYANLCRKGYQYKFVETNYDMYDVSYFDRQEAFRKLESTVDAAMANGDFKLYLQPKVNVKTGEITSAEALVRWIDPVKGMIPLGDFLPQMEENGYIRDLDCYLFNVACGYLDRWYNQLGKKISISFNLDRAYFNGSFFMPEYIEVFNRYNIPPDCVCIEVLESIVLDDMDKLRELVDEMHLFGFSCALDDFGSGFSTFGVLTSVPLDELKIDRFLFRDINNNKERTIIKHIVDIAHDLGLICIAEGIETQDYADYLRDIGCDYIQGFLYYRPMPVDEFEARFVTGTWK